MSLPIPGVPQLPLGAATAPVVTIASEAISALLYASVKVPPAWGVFDAEGNQVLFPDSVLEFSHREEYDISNFPVQEGAFASYNKVIKPFEIQLRFSKGGTQTDREEFLSEIEALAESIDLYTVVTPERTYEDVNLERYEVTRRGARGAYFLTEVDLYFIQIIQVAAQYTTTGITLPNSQSAAAQPVSNVGNVQPQTPTSQQTQMGQAALSTSSIPDPSLSGL